MSRPEGGILAALEAQVARDPGRLLYSFVDSSGGEAERLTRAGFLKRVRALAAHVPPVLGARPGDRVLLAYPPGLEMISAFFGCAHSGLIPVPVAAPSRFGLNGALERIAAIAADCNPIGVLTHSSVSALVEGSPGYEAVGSGRGGLLGTMPWLATDLVPTADARSEPPHRPWSTLFLQYTSGSTRDPKGVIVTHANVLANAGLTVDHSGAIGVCWLPQHHDMGLVGYYLNAAIAGGTLHGFPPALFVQRPALWFEFISRYRATATSAPNFALEHCLRRLRPAAERLEGIDLSSLKFLMVAAEPVKPDIYREFLQTFGPLGLRPEALIVAYGLAENTLAVSSYGRRSLSVDRNELARGKVRESCRAADVASARHLMSCGTPLFGNALAIVDPSTRKALADGEIGEIWVSGPSRCAGYWNDPAGSKQTFRARLAGRGRGPTEDYLRTGDAGFRWKGELYVCGRLKDLIIRHGQNFYPQDIEAAVERRCPGIRGVAAFEGQSGGAAPLVVMAEVADAAVTADPDRIAAVVRADVGLVPDRVVLVPPKSIPKTSSGKVRRYLAAQMLADGRVRILRSGSADRSHGSPSAGAGAHGLPFAAIRARYAIAGHEACSLADAGVDSLDLVLFLHEMITILGNAGAADLAERLDIRSVQERSIAELFRLVERVRSDPSTTRSELELLVRRQERDAPAADREAMRRDLRNWGGIADRLRSGDAATAGSILLTGATGFLGPFLLTSLLEQTKRPIVALVRAASDEQARERLCAHLGLIAAPDAGLLKAFDERVTVLRCDLERPRLGLDEGTWDHLTREIAVIHHNGAAVNYLWTYGRMREANVLGTGEILRFAAERRLKTVNYVSTTFVFGWATKPVLLEDDGNGDIDLLDFGYSQSKWVAEQMVLSARRNGLPVRIFRPALIAPSLDGRAVSSDITLRLFAFMIKHGIGVTATNQLSLLPADVAAANMVAIAQDSGTLGKTFHVTRTGHTTVADALEVVTRLTGRAFVFHDLEAFVPEVIRRCTHDDSIYPLLDFLIGSIDKISATEFKRYDNAFYQQACASCAGSRAEPSMEQTMAGVLRYLARAGLVDAGIVNAAVCDPLVRRPAGFSGATRDDLPLRYG